MERPRRGHCHYHPLEEEVKIQKDKVTLSICKIRTFLLPFYRWGNRQTRRPGGSGTRVHPAPHGAHEQAQCVLLSCLTPTLQPLSLHTSPCMDPLGKNAALRGPRIEEFWRSSPGKRLWHKFSNRINWCKLELPGLPLFSWVWHCNGSI